MSRALPVHADWVAATQRPHGSWAAPLPTSHARLSTRQTAKAFNQPLSFDTSSVTNMGYMFYNAGAFNQPLKFDTSSVTNMKNMFAVRSAPCPAPRLQSSPSLHAACATVVRRPPVSRAAPRHAPCALLSTLGRMRTRSTSR